MMVVERYFPTGIVTGEAFCNREKERDYLKKHLAQNAHIVLMSPRRYGKSSLIAQFTLDQKLPCASVDLLPATSGKYVKNAIIDGVTCLLDAMAPSFKKNKQKWMAHFAQMNPVIELSAFGQRVKLTPEEKTPEEIIMKLLMSLDKTAGELKQRLIFVIDEFQQIAMLEGAHSLEASIRHAVERSKHVFYIFSGSNRTLLEEMFKNKNRPLYHLCDEMKLTRIEKEHYLPFIEKASQGVWKKSLPVESIEMILSLTECHPYYVSRVCRMLWDLDSIPEAEMTQKIWRAYVDMQKADWVSELIRELTVNQRTILAGFAKSLEREPSGKVFANRLQMSASSIQRTIDTLTKKDLIYRDDQGFYHVLNPVIKAVLSEDKYFD